MQGQGEMLKNAIRGKGMTIEEAAEKMGMSRQRFGYYLQKAKLPDELMVSVVDLLGIDIDINQVSEPGTDYKRKVIPTKPNLDDLIYFMGEILKLSFPELKAALIKEQDPDRRKVIKEVIYTKEKMELLEERLKDKESLIDSQKQLIDELKRKIKT